MTIQHVEYGQELIVAVRYKDKWMYFLSEKDFWILDQRSWAQSFRDAGYELPENYSDRFDLPVVDQENAEAFLAHMDPYRVSPEELRASLEERLSAPSDADEAALLLPALLVDFDSQQLQASFPEPFPFEKHLPIGWTIPSGSIFQQVPEKLRYWTIDGRDYSSLAEGNIPS